MSAPSLPPDLLVELKNSISGDLRLDLASRILYSTDASIYQAEQQASGMISGALCFEN